MTLKAALGLAAAEDDDGKAAGAGQTITRQQVRELLGLIDEVGAEADALLRFFKIKGFAELPARRFRQALDAQRQEGTRLTMLEIINCIQGSVEGAQARLGIPTASEFASILTKGRGGAESRSRQSYLYKLAGERLTGEVMESFTSPHMERGKLMEEEARSAYSFVTGLECESVGFLRRGRAGASPDALIGRDGLLEIKTKLPHLLIEALLKGEFPADHKAQCQASSGSPSESGLISLSIGRACRSSSPAPTATKLTSANSLRRWKCSTTSSIRSLGV